MVITYEHDADDIDLSPQNPAIVVSGNRVVGRLDDEATSLVKVECQTTGEIALEQVRSPKNHISRLLRCQQIGKAIAQFLCALCTELLLGDSLFCTQALESGVPEKYVHDGGGRKFYSPNR